MFHLKEGPPTTTNPTTDMALSVLSSSSSSSSSSLHMESIVQRYQQAKNIYLQRRMQHLLLEHMTTFDGTTFEGVPEINETKDDFNRVEEVLGQSNKTDIDTDIDGMTSLGVVIKNKDNNKQLMSLLEEEEDKDQGTAATADQKQALDRLYDMAATIRKDSQRAQDLYQSIMVLQRQELEAMLEELERSAAGTAEAEAADDHDMEMLAEETEQDEPEITEEELQQMQQQLEQLQQRKRQLQEELATVEQETQRVQAHTMATKQHLLTLQPSQDEDVNELEKKIEELKEMKAWYDGLRQVMEELGGVKILQVTDDSTNGHLILQLQLYDDYQVQVQLEAYRQAALKLVAAKWITEPIVRPQITDAMGDNFYLSLPALDDLVEVAKTTLGPAEDVRFLVREALARIRILQERVNDLAELRQTVLTRVVGDQMVCSLPEGISVVLRLYELVVRIDQIVGVGGWEPEIIEQIRAGIDETNATPKSILQQIQEHIERLKQEGKVPPTPKMPIKKKFTLEE